MKKNVSKSPFRTTNEKPKNIYAAMKSKSKVIPQPKKKNMNKMFEALDIADKHKEKIIEQEKYQNFWDKINEEKVNNQLENAIGNAFKNFGAMKVNVNK